MIKMMKLKEFDGNDQKWAKIERISAQKYTEICRNVLKSTRICRFCAEIDRGPRRWPAGRARRARPAPRETSKNHWFSLPFRGCGLPRQRPAEAVPSWPAEAGEDEPKCAEICRNLQNSPEIAQNLRICEILLQNWSKTDQILIKILLIPWISMEIN